MYVTVTAVSAPEESASIARFLEEKSLVIEFTAFDQSDENKENGASDIMWNAFVMLGLVLYLV